MSPRPDVRTRRLQLHRETLRDPEDPSTVKFGPQTSERRACCGETVDLNGQPITLA